MVQDELQMSEGSGAMKKLRMYYYLKNQSELFSSPQMFETSDMKEWERAVSIAHENEYKIVKIEKVE